KKNFLPFWEEAMDEEFGGVFTCYTNLGDKRDSDKKYIWSQGRLLWLGCKLLEWQKQGDIELSEKWSDIVKKTYKFLEEHAIMSNNHIVFAVDRNGKQIEDQMDTSIFADCFYVLGCNAYADLYRCKHIFEHTLSIYYTIKKRVKSNDFRSESYPIPDSYRSHSVPMILNNDAQELYDTAKKLKINEQSQSALLKDVEDFFCEIISLKEENRIIEMYSGKNSNTLLERHVNPGHTIECAWFMLHSIDSLEVKNLERYINDIEKLVKHALTIGWDKKYGGLYRFVDKYGEKPKGTLIGTAYEQLVLDTWDTKLWWPHAESLYSTLLLYSLTKKKEWLQQYEKVKSYVFQTFPNENKEIEEWVQIRDRKGDPLHQVVALPVKDPFHIIRAYIKIIHLFKGCERFAAWDS